MKVKHLNLSFNYKGKSKNRMKFEEAKIVDAGEILTLQKAAYVTEAVIRNVFTIHILDVMSYIFQTGKKYGKSQSKRSIAVQEQGYRHRQRNRRQRNSRAPAAFRGGRR